MTTEEKKSRRTIFILFMNACELKSKKIGQEFVQVPEDWKDQEFSKDWPRRIYEGLKVGMPGNVYSVDEDAGSDKSSIYPSTLRYAGRWHDEDAVVRWQAAYDVDRTRMEVARRGKKEGKRRLYLERLEPIRRAAWSMTAPERALLVYKVIQAIMSPNPLKTDDRFDDD